MIPINITTTLFQAGSRRAAGRMSVASPDPSLRFYYYTWSGKHALLRMTLLECEVCDGQRYYLEISRVGEQGRVARVVGSITRHGFEVEEDDGCQVIVENEVRLGIYYEGRAFPDLTQPCMCCGYVDYRPSWKPGCRCNLVQLCPACRKCQDHCACLPAASAPEPEVAGTSL